jgi:hypothetical protein
MERVCLFFLWLTVVFLPTRLFSHPAHINEVEKAKNFSVFEENGKVGLKDEEGEILIPASYDAIGWSNGKLQVIDKVVGYQSNGSWGLIHTSNKLVTGAEFLDLKPGEGSLLVAQKKSPLSQRPSFGIINTSGKTIIPFQYDGLHLSNMRAIVMSRSGTRYHFGLIDLDGKVVIPMDFQRIYSLGSLRYAVENFDNRTAIFSDEGDRVTDFAIDSISAFKKDFAVIYQDQRQGLIDRNGQMVLTPVYGEVRLNDDGTIQARDIDTWFFLDGQNKLARKYEADGVRPLSANHYAVVSGGKLQLTDNDFKPLQPFNFASLGDFRNGLALYRNGGSTGVINLDGEIQIPAAYQAIIVDENVFIASPDSFKNRWVILDLQGKTITEKHYQTIAPFNGKFFPVRNRGFWGAVNSSGKEIITCVHDSIIQQKGNNIVVKFKGEYGIINLNENWIVTPQPYPLELLNDETYFEFAGETTFFKSLTGDIIYFSDNQLEYNDGYIVEHLATGANWIINHNGIIIDRSNQPDRVEKVFPETEGLRAIYKDGKYGFIDEQGRLRIANRYEEVQPFLDGMAAVRIKNRWGFINHQEKLVVQPNYDHVENFRSGHAIVRQNGLWGLIDQSGRIVLPIRYDEITLTGNNLFRLRLRTMYGLADGSGTIVIHPRYDDLTATDNGYVIVKRGGKFGLLTLAGVSTIPMIYDGLTFDRHHNQFMALKRSAWKTIDKPRSTTPQQ